MRTHLAQLVARLVLAIGFLLDGIPRLSAGGHYAYESLLRQIGIPAPGVMAWLGAAVEIALAVAVLLGAYVTVAGICMLAAMLALLFRRQHTDPRSEEH